MAMINRFRDLEIWNEGMSLCEKIYKLTENFPKHELYGLCSQMRRCSVSIPSNIAEGFVRKHGREFKQFVAIALGSLAELETQAELAYRMAYTSEEELSSLMENMDLLGKKMTRFYQGIRF